MPTSDLFTDSIWLMALGMGTVFVFLTVLVIATSIMSSLAKKFAPPETAPNRSGDATAEPDQSELIAVITTAIHQYRSKKK